MTTANNLAISLPQRDLNEFLQLVVNGLFDYRRKDCIVTNDETRYTFNHRNEFYKGKAFVGRVVILYYPFVIHLV